MYQKGNITATGARGGATKITSHLQGQETQKTHTYVYTYVYKSIINQWDHKK